jgi:monothiol glutaredoxin
LRAIASKKRSPERCGAGMPVQSAILFEYKSSLTPSSSRSIAMSRQILAETQIHPAIREKIESYNTDIVGEVKAAIAANDIVVVGMTQNPFPKKARKILDAQQLAYRYLEYGSYLKGWRRRGALKMWTGWPTFPMVFVKGMLVGGADDLQRLIDSGELEKMAREA